jgi:hypothetical protein
MNDPFNIIPIIIALVFLYTFLYILWEITDRLRRRWASANWQAAPAAVTAKGLHTVMRLRSGRKLYRLKVDYRYVVMGRAFEKNLKLDRTTEALANATLERIGQTIEVRYNPEKPDDHISALEQVDRQDAFKLLILLLTVLIMFSWVQDIFRR